MSHSFMHQYLRYCLIHRFDMPPHTQKADFNICFCITSHPMQRCAVFFCFYPGKRAGFIFEAPGIHNFKRVRQGRHRRPQKQSAIFFTQFFYIQSANLVSGHCLIMLLGSKMPPVFPPAPKVLPGRISIDDLILHSFSITQNLICRAVG